jgi:hypothetical protein
MVLFSDIEQFKEFTGGAVNLSISMESIDPIIHLTAQKHLLDWLGEELWEDLLTGFLSPSTEQIALLPFVQRPLALLACYEYSDVGSVQFSESGIVRMEGEYAKTAYKYQVNAYKNFMLHAGYDSIEALLKFLQKNKVDYPTWATSEGAEKNQELLLNYADQFRRAYGKQLSRYTFECLRPLIEDIEAFAIVPLTGKPLIDALKNAIQTNTLTAPLKKLLRILHKALANFAIEEALKKHWVRIEGANILQEESLEPQSYTKTSSPSTQPVSTGIRFHDAWANRHITEAKNLLETNIDDYPEYAIHLNRLLGLPDAATAEERTLKQEELKWVADYEGPCAPEESDHRLGAPCNCSTYCNCTKKKRKGVVRL